VGVTVVVTKNGGAKGSASGESFGKVIELSSADCTHAASE
jgi:hypothetical protein